MNKISYAELKDMEFYNPEYKKEYWENKNTSDFLEYYEKNNIILDVTTWVRLNDVNDTMHYKDAFSNQVCYIRDDIAKGLFYNINCDLYEDYERYKNVFRKVCVVDGNHRSKSINLPVYRIYADGKDDLVLTIGNNFYGYYVSVESKLPIVLDFKDLFDIEAVPNFLYGFKDERVFKSYNESKTHFTFGVNNKYHFYVIMWMISKYWKNNF